MTQVLALVYAATPFDKRGPFAATPATWEALRSKGLVEMHPIAQRWVVTEAGRKLLDEAHIATVIDRADLLGE